MPELSICRFLNLFIKKYIVYVLSNLFISTCTYILPDIRPFFHNGLLLFVVRNNKNNCYEATVCLVMRSKDSVAALTCTSHF